MAHCKQAKPLTVHPEISKLARDMDLDLPSGIHKFMMVLGSLDTSHRTRDA